MNHFQRSEKAFHTRKHSRTYHLLGFVAVPISTYPLVARA
uniref:Uncharacterized protein n=1 Tax=Utricularia reniformis TaxID=192314 RepID=A0A1Y0AZP9_9LAMI|nr:hypothetical protein AEK19_MT0341 [Utricularia reniformis]ART30613.1 hypothetical protein AEK19_MT0341 [Utricularia reniformis]